MTVKSQPDKYRELVAKIRADRGPALEKRLAEMRAKYEKRLQK